MKNKKVFSHLSVLLAQSTRNLGPGSPSLRGGSTTSNATTDIETPASSLIKIRDLGNFVRKGISGAILLAGVLVLVYLLWGGVQLIISTGDKAKLEAGRDRVVAAFIGLAIVAAAWAIWKLIIFFFGIGAVGEGAGGTVFFKFGD